jgi:hypothetical protein
LTDFKVRYGAGILYMNYRDIMPGMVSPEVSFTGQQYNNINNYYRDLTDLPPLPDAGN